MSHKNRKGSYCCYQKASTGVDVYADKNNPHDHCKVMKKLYDLWVDFNDKRRNDYCEDKNKHESHQMSVAADMATKELLKMKVVNGGSYTYCLITVKKIWMVLYVQWIFLVILLKL